MYEEVEDVCDVQLVIVVIDNSVNLLLIIMFDVFGNIGDGCCIYLQVEIVILFDDYGMGDSCFNLVFFLCDMEVIDLIIGEFCCFQGNEDWCFFVNFCQNLIEYNLFWGWSGMVLGDEDFYCFDEIYFFSCELCFDFWVEIIVFFDVIVCLFWQDLNVQVNECECCFYFDVCDVGMLEVVEICEQDLGGFVVLIV